MWHIGGPADDDDVAYARYVSPQSAAGHGLVDTISLGIVIKRLSPTRQQTGRLILSTQTKPGVLAGITASN